MRLQEKCNTYPTPLFLKGLLVTAKHMEVASVTAIASGEKYGLKKFNKPSLYKLYLSKKYTIKEIKRKKERRQ